MVKVYYKKKKAPVMSGKIKNHRTHSYSVNYVPYIVVYLRFGIYIPHV
jgi:hypothetical protein